MKVFFLQNRQIWLLCRGLTVHFLKSLLELVKSPLVLLICLVALVIIAHNKSFVNEISSLVRTRAFSAFIKGFLSFSNFCFPYRDFEVLSLSREVGVFVLGGVNVDFFWRLFFICQNGFWNNGCSLRVHISFLFFSLFIRLFKHLK